MKRRIAGTSSTELPPQDLDLSHLTRPSNLAAVAHAWSEDVFHERHRDCGHDWECVECGKRVCARCEVSPGEFQWCSDCDWFRGGAA